MRNALYALGSHLTCGWIENKFPKELSSSVSRTLTMPSIAANATLSNKHSTNSRRVAYSPETRTQNSPNGHHPIVSTPSRDTLLRPIVSEKSISSISSRSRASVTYEFKENDSNNQFSTQQELVVSTPSPDKEDMSDSVCHSVVVKEVNNPDASLRRVEMETEERILQSKPQEK